MRQEFHIVPVPKPRMTRRDRWKKRPAVQRYWDFKDRVREQGVHLPEAGARITFVMPMPKSWSGKKQKEMDRQPHQQKPDLDNLLKGLGDAVYDDDSGIHQFEARKIWGKQGMLIIEYEETAL